MENYAKGKLWFRAENTGVIIESTNPPEHEGYMVCHVCCDENGKNLDNRVKLITSSPEMYQALKWLTDKCNEIMDDYNNGLTPDKVNWAEIVSVADAKARNILSKIEE